MSHLHGAEVMTCKVNSGLRSFIVMVAVLLPAPACGEPGHHTRCSTASDTTELTLSTSGGISPGAKNTRPHSLHVPMIGEMTARNFMDHLAAGDIRRAALLMDDTVNFDGTVVKGHDKVAAMLSRIMERVGGSVQWRYVRIVSGEEALRRFGPLPRRIAGTDMKGAVVALGRRPSGGLAVIFRRTGEDTWRVVAMTD